MIMNYFIIYLIRFEAVDYEYVDWEVPNALETHSLAHCTNSQRDLIERYTLSMQLTYHCHRSHFASSNVGVIAKIRTQDH